MTTAPMTAGSEELVASLARRVSETVARMTGGADEAALLDYPNYDNPGDAAIWLGSVAALRETGTRPAYVAERRSFSARSLDRALPDGPVLINGGGNLGDLWPVIQRHREQVVESLQHRRVVQLPQTIHFESGEGLARARGVLAGHADLVVLARDQQSLETARNRLEVEAELCPDTAFALGPLPRDGEGEGILWLARADGESGTALPRALPDSVTVTDWQSDRDRGMARVAARRGLKTYARVAAGAGGPARRPLERAYEGFARDALDSARRTLSRGRVVVTDRLHGHILSLLLGIPHVLLDNSYGKLRGFHDAWTSGCDLVHWAGSPHEALEIAIALEARS